jgi:hypothetical protein
MGGDYLRFTATDPETHRQMTKNLSLAKYGREKATKIGEEWRDAVLKGLYSPGILKDSKFLQKMDLAKQRDSDSDSSSDDDCPIKFKFKSIDTIVLPDDKFGVSFLLLGATRSGKSTLMNHLYETYFKNFISITHTASAQSEIYKPLAKTTAICPMFAPELITETSKINGATKNHYKFLHIIDDIVDKKNSKELIKLLTIGRNHRLSTIITGQELSIFNSIGRSNINYICCFRLNSDMAIEKVVKTYLRSAFPSEMRIPDMIKCYKKMTENHGFFCINNLNDEIFVSRLNNPS